MASLEELDLRERADSNPQFDQTRSSKFRFKSNAKRTNEDEGKDETSHRSSKRRKVQSSKHSSSHAHHKDRRKRHSKPLDDDPSQYDDSYLPNSRTSQYLDPETAFRESLFDALADDEGAAFWQGVYGQPIHTYPNEKQGPQGELERMTEAEYAEFVRAKMWEKSHEHIVEQRRRREEEREKQKAARMKQHQADDAFGDLGGESFVDRIAESLRRGQERKMHRRWQDAWKRYVNSWETFTGVVSAQSTEKGTLAGEASRAVIPWPVESGKCNDVDKEQVEKFLDRAPPKDSDSTALLKIERIRWHPDKMQQRFGQNKLDEDTVKMITAVFQVVDRLWIERKGTTR